jgi:hypothetical protein
MSKEVVDMTSNGSAPAIDPGTGHAKDLEAQVIARAVQDPAFRARLLADPRAVFAELGLSIPPEIQIRAVEETAGQYYLVLPAVAERPSGASLSDTQLEAVTGGGDAAPFTYTDNSCDTGWTGCASGQSGCNVDGG